MIDEGYKSTNPFQKIRSGEKQTFDRVAANAQFEIKPTNATHSANGDYLLRCRRVICAATKYAIVLIDSDAKYIAGITNSAIPFIPVAPGYLPVSTK